MKYILAAVLFLLSLPLFCLGYWTGESIWGYALGIASGMLMTAAGALIGGDDED